MKERKNVVVVAAAAVALSISFFTVGSAMSRGAGQKQTSQVLDIFSMYLYQSSAVQAQNNLKMLAYLNSGDVASARDLSSALLKENETALTRFTPSSRNTEVTQIFRDAKQQISNFRSSAANITSP